MTYLQLCRRLAQECGLSGTVPTGVTNQTGELKRIVDWVASAWDEIQSRHRDWRWMRVGFTLSTTSGDDDYAYSSATDALTAAAIARFRRWLVTDPENPPKCYLSSSGVSAEYWLSYLSYERFRTLYQIGTEQIGQPAHITINPQNQLVLGPTPDDTYVITGEFQRGNQTLSADADEPEMPDDFHMLIVYDAMLKYAGFDAANEIYHRGLNEGRPLRRRLELDQRPRIRIAGPLI